MVSFLLPMPSAAPMPAPMPAPRKAVPAIVGPTTKSPREMTAKPAPLAVAREVDAGVVRRVEAARQAVAVLRADDDLLARRKRLDGRPVAARAPALRRGGRARSEREQ